MRSRGRLTTDFWRLKYSRPDFTDYRTKTHLQMQQIERVKRKQRFQKDHHLTSPVRLENAGQARPT
jgi:hypothetical protein